MAKDNDGCGFAILVGVGFAIVTAIPKPVWITIGVLAALALITVAVKKSIEVHEQRRKQRAEWERQRQVAEEAAARRQREENARRARQQRLEAMGPENAVIVDSAEAAVKRVLDSEAARAGWLGDVDFTADVAGIGESLKRAYELRKVAHQLSVLDKPSDDDRKILSEAQNTVARLEKTAVERVALIQRCAKEANLVDESLRQERNDARTAEQRAELHAKLSSMLYGIEAAPSATSGDSMADAVMARVSAYREIKTQIQLARGS